MPIIVEKLVARQDAELAVNDGANNETSIKISRDVAELLCQPLPLEGETVDVQFKLDPKNLVRNACDIVNALPLLLAKDGSPVTYTPEFCASLFGPIGSFFHSMTETSLYRAELKNNLGHGFCLQGFNEKNNGFNIRHYLVADRSKLVFKKENAGDVSVQLVYTPQFCSATPCSDSKQKIIFGAPGTGKSFKLNIEANKSFPKNCIERVTFHPNYSYAQFVGTYKPISSGYKDVADGVRRTVNVLQDSSKTAQEKYDLLYGNFKTGDMLTRLPLLLGLYSDGSFNTKKMDGTAASGNNGVERNHGIAIRPYVTLGINETICYKYIPGPFMRTYIRAKRAQQNGTNDKFLLIIEEINRANVAAVFGDVFQLLDRNSKDESRYPIAASEDIKRYLRENGITDCCEIKIPSNMYIWATMNSADQGVFPMDTAFKRRWEFEYIGINEKKDDVKDYEIPMQKKINADGSITHKWINWNDLRTKINDKMTDMKINEDKLLGPFFISEDKLKSVKDRNEKAAENFVKSFKSKVLMYLFEDAAKMHPDSLFNIEKIGKLRFSEIQTKFDDVGEEIFNFPK